MKIAAAGSRILRGPNNTFKKHDEDAAEHRRHVERGRNPGSLVETKAAGAAQIRQADAEQAGSSVWRFPLPERLPGSRCTGCVVSSRSAGLRWWWLPAWVSEASHLGISVTGARQFVRTVAITDSPGRSRSAVAWPASSTIFTGTRCTIFVKLPVALSGGNNANCEPLAGDRLIDFSSEDHSRKCIHRISAGSPAWIWRTCVSL